MSDTATLKKKLLNAAWREYTRLTVQDDEGAPVELSIRRPPDSVLKEIFREARAKAPASNGAEGAAPADARDAEAGLDFRARLVATCVFLPGAVRPLFSNEEAEAWPWLGEAFAECMAAVNPSKALEKARGN